MFSASGETTAPGAMYYRLAHVNEPAVLETQAFVPAKQICRNSTIVRDSLRWVGGATLSQLTFLGDGLID